ncbi:hypothetical protein [Bradyrhizobium liaoningense]|uniref:hypothetical protein n=1 Tax=Bradyrhizobium liaoningense TaxID=43992 RepID=UPI001BA61071|nr:hypothetical protein [Bradyrhizobium liaoningense]MBR0714968.1 hypothetical protein [Bradyrhizobium liaoningense]
MIGGSVSKWTMSYFAMGIAWLFAAEALMIAGFGYPGADVAAPETLVLVHVVAIGWLSMCICGALLQFVPVLVGKALVSEAGALPVLGLLTAGLIALLLGFLALGGRLPPWLWLLPVGTTLLVAGFGLFAANIVMTMWRARPLAAAARFVLVGLAALGATAALGTSFAWALAGYGGSGLNAVLDAGIPLHAIAGLGGWLTLTAMGVSYRLLAMFMMSPDVDIRRSRTTLLVGAATLGLAVAGGLAAIAMRAGLDLVFVLTAVCGVATAALYGRDVVDLYRKRKRRTLELNTSMAVYALTSLAASVVLGLALAVRGSFAADIGAFVFLLGFGWLSGLVLAKLYKIVAFLTWLETYGPVMGRVPTPRVQDLVVEPRATKWFAAYFASVWLATALLFAGQAPAFRVAAFGMMVATAGIVQELLRTRMLADVTTNARLPQGAKLPRLLHS